MIIKWLGHSCFLMTDSRGVRVMTDPCDPKTGYPISPMEVDIVTSSHDHYDHNYLDIALGAEAITGPGSYDVKGVKIQGFATWHDSEQGARRGPNTVFVMELDGVRIMHSGDLGHIPDQAAIAAIGKVDVVLLPIGGVYTIDYRQALELVGLVKPSIVIPMHYQTDQLKFHLEELSPFLENARDCAIHRMRQSEAVVTRESLGDVRIVVLEHDK